MQKLAPIVLFTYNRPEHTKKTMQALIANKLSKQSYIYIYADAPKTNASPLDKQKIHAVLKYLYELKSLNQKNHFFKDIIIIERPYNFGLADSIIDGVTNTINTYEKIIVLEDDILVSPVFLDYMNDALNKYAQNLKVWSICAWSYPITSQELTETYFSRVPHCWGWGSWKDRWQYYKRDIQWVINNFNKEDIYHINLEGHAKYWYDFLLNKKGKIKSWAIFNYLISYKHNALSLLPKQAYIRQIGFDGSGVHCGNDGNIYNHQTLNTTFPVTYPKEVIESNIALQQIQAFQKSLYKPFSTRIKNKVIKTFKQLITNGGGADNYPYLITYYRYKPLALNSLSYKPTIHKHIISTQSNIA